MRTRRTHMRLLQLLFVVALLGLLPALAPIAQAQPATRIVYFPWVSNGETIGGQGPWTGVLSFQNRSDDFCALQVFAGRDGAWVPTTQLSLTAGSSRSVSASGLSVPSPGAPMRFQAGCDIVVSLKQYTPNVRTTPWSDGARVVTGYTGLSEADIEAAHATPTSAWFLPIVQTNSDWNTFIRVANLSETTATSVRVDIYPSSNPDGVDGAVLTMQQNVGVAGSVTIDALASLGSEFVGFARISAEEDIGVVARRVKPGVMLAISNV
ncbi:MAG: hypothetical protein M3439_01655, partial [Chloroflexota bacterium]|nr:hypothetical protein [Chloroflexota bacterium]